MNVKARRCTHSAKVQTSVFDGCFWRNRRITKRCQSKVAARFSDFVQLCDGHATEHMAKYPDQSAPEWVNAAEKVR
jgi:hypothetical protein